MITTRCIYTVSHYYPAQLYYDKHARHVEAQLTSLIRSLESSNPNRAEFVACCSCMGSRVTEAFGSGVTVPYLSSRLAEATEEFNSRGCFRYTTTEPTAPSFNYQRFDVFVDPVVLVTPSDRTIRLTATL